MFWADFGINAKIEQAYLTGQNRQTFRYLRDSRLPSVFVVDFNSERLYLMFAQSYDYPYRIMSCKTLGGGYNYWRHMRNFRQHIHPVDLDLYGDHLYWPDRNSRSIYWINKTHPRDMLSFGHVTDGILVGAVVFDESRQPYSKLN